MGADFARMSAPVAAHVCGARLQAAKEWLPGESARRELRAQVTTAEERATEADRRATEAQERATAAAERATAAEARATAAAERATAAVARATAAVERAAAAEARLDARLAAAEAHAAGAQCQLQHAAAETGCCWQVVGAIMRGRRHGRSQKESQSLPTALQEAAAAASTAELRRAITENQRLRSALQSLRPECPILVGPSQDLVVASDGETYDRQVIEQWLREGNGTSPLSRERLERRLYPNRFARRVLQTLEELNLDG